MKEELQKLRNQLINAKVFSPEVIQWLEEENVWNIWVPKEYGGLGFTLVEGLKKLKTFAEIDGSIGWTVTLCSACIMADRKSIVFCSIYWIDYIGRN